MHKKSLKIVKLGLVVYGLFISEQSDQLHQIDFIKLGVKVPRKMPNFACVKNFVVHFSFKVTVVYFKMALFYWTGCSYQAFNPFYEKQ